MRMWSLKGQQPEVFTYGGRLRQQLIGAINSLAGKVHVAFSDTVKASQFQYFLEGLLARYNSFGKILLILDNARAHHSKELEPLLEANKDRLEFLFLPPYSPDLNPMEWFWKFLRKHVTHNTFFDTFKKIQRALIKFIRKFKLSLLEIQTRCSITKLIPLL
ncbi:MAG: IS630 family transposase [Candidatus Thorarchaeota archaeon]